MLRRGLKLVGVVLLLASAVVAQDAGERIRVAQVNNEIISYRDLEEFCEEYAFSKWSEIVRKFEGEERKLYIRALMRNVLEDFIDSKILLQKAKEVELKDEQHREFIEDILERAMKDYLRRAGSQAKLHDDLRRRGRTIADLRNRYRERLVVERHLYLTVRKWIWVRPEEIQEYFEEHRDEIRRPEEYEYRRIWFNPVEYESREQAFEQAQILLAKLQESGDNFAELADTFSYDRLERAGGYCKGEVEVLSDQLKEALSKLEPGQIHPGVLEFGPGYMILKLEKKHPSRQLDFEEVCEGIEARLKAQKVRERTKQYIEQLRSKACIAYAEGWEPQKKD